MHQSHNKHCKTSTKLKTIKVTAHTKHATSIAQRNLRKPLNHPKHNRYQHFHLTNSKSVRPQINNSQRSNKPTKLTAASNYQIYYKLFTSRATLNLKQIYTH
eukprot:gene13133-8979_t